MHPRQITLAAVLLLAGCSGTIDEAASAEEPGAGTDPGGINETEPGALPATVLRRLTRTEYNFTIRDLLDDKTNPGDALPGDGVIKVFDNNAATLKVDELALEKYDAIAEQVVERAMTPGSKTRATLVPCDLAKDPKGCARTAIAGFARRAWRRPVGEAEVSALVTALDEATAEGGPAEDGLKIALRSILISPHFLYRVEVNPPGAAETHRVSPFELATRLSYFIFSSTPDAELSARADDGTLLKPEVRANQIARMLSDPKADALFTNFAAQWLLTRDILKADVQPDPKLYPSFDFALRQAMQQETELYFSAFLREDLSVADMIDGDFTYLNGRLAKHYIIAGLGGQTTPKKVSLAGTQRLGLLTQGAMLTSRSHSNATSPTKRGDYTLKRLLCQDVGAPPANAMAVASMEAAKADPRATPRDRQYAITHAHPECVGCHDVLDPLGYALDHFDPVGLWRDRYPGGQAIDATGRVGDIAFDGVTGPAGLAAAIKQDGRFPRCLAQQLSAFALGREAADAVDQTITDAVTKAYTAKGARLRQLVAELAQSETFLSRRPSP